KRCAEFWGTRLNSPPLRRLGTQRSFRLAKTNQLVRREHSFPKRPCSIPRMRHKQPPPAQPVLLRRSSGLTESRFHFLWQVIEADRLPARPHATKAGAGDDQPV